MLSKQQFKQSTPYPSNDWIRKKTYKQNKNGRILFKIIYIIN